MTLLEAIQTRHSVRKYRPEPIDGGGIGRSAAADKGRIMLMM